MRIILRRIPRVFGFTWWQFAIMKPCGSRHYWAVRNIARAHQFGPLWICTMRSDCVERAMRATNPHTRTPTTEETP